MNKSGTFLVIVYFLIMLPSLSFAGAVITYHGRILDTYKRPVESSNVVFRIRIYSPKPEKCLLYEETRTVDMTNSQGVFVIPIGDGAGTRTASDPELQMEKVFANNPNITLDKVNTPKLFCNSGLSFTPSLLSQRHLEVFFDDSSGIGEQALPLMDVNYVPLAVSSHDTQHVGGTPANAILRLTSGTAEPLSPANFLELKNLLNGTSSTYELVGKLNDRAVPTLTNGQVLGWNGSWVGVTPLVTESDPMVKIFAKTDLPTTCGTDKFLRPKADGTGFECIGVTGANGGTVTSLSLGTGLLNVTSPGSPVTTSGTLAVDVGTNANQIVQMGSDGKLPLMDGSRITNVTASALSNTASINITGGIVSTGDIQTSGKIQSGGDILAGGNIQTNNAITGKRLFLYDETTPSPPQTPGSIGLRAPPDINGTGGASYILTLPEKKGTAGQVLTAKDNTGILEWTSPSTGSVTSILTVPPLSVDSSNPNTPKVTLPKASNLLDGYLSAADYNSFSSKQDAGNYVKALEGDVSSSTYVGGNLTTSVDKIKGIPVNGVPTLAGQVLRYESGSFVPNFISMLDLRSKVTGTQALGSSCGADKTLTFDSLTDSLACSPIAINKTQVTGFGALADKGSVDLATTDAIGILPTSKGGTGSSAIGTANQILGVNNSANGLEYKTLAAGAGVTITQGVNLVTISAAGTGGTVTNITSENEDIIVTAGSSNAILKLNSASTGGIGDANKIVKLDGSGQISKTMIPNLDISKLSTGTLPIERGGTNSATALVNKRIMISSAGSIIESAAISPNRVLISNGDGLPTESSVTSTELSYLSGVTSSIQTQLSGKSSSTGWTNHSVMGVDGTGALKAIPGSANGSILNWTPAGPQWTNARFPASTSANQLLYSSADNIVGGIPTATNAILKADTSGVPSWSVISDDNFEQYALLAGRSGGQTLRGGSAANENLVLDSTSNSSKGNIVFAPNGGNVGIGIATPQQKLSVAGTIESTVGGIKFPDGTIQGTAAGSGPFRAAEARSTTVQSIPYGTWIIVNNLVGKFDTGGFFTPSMPDRFTIPTGVNFVRVTGYMGWVSNTTGPRYIQIFKNGGSIYHGPGGSPFIASSDAYSDSSGRGQVISPPIQVQSGDYIQVAVYQSSGSTLNLLDAGISIEAMNGNTSSSGGSGTANYIPLWGDSTTLGNSPMAVKDGKVGVGTATPTAALDVQGGIRGSSLEVTGKVKSSNLREMVHISSEETTSSSSYVDIPGLTATVNGSGLPVIMMVSSSVWNTVSGANGYFRLVVDGVPRAANVYQLVSSSSVTPVHLQWMEVLAPGVHTIKVQFATNMGVLKIGWTNSSSSILLFE